MGEPLQQKARERGKNQEFLKNSEKRSTEDIFANLRLTGVGGQGTLYIHVGVNILQPIFRHYKFQLYLTPTLISVPGTLERTTENQKVNNIFFFCRVCWSRMQVTKINLHLICICPFYSEVLRR
jgi:hypothetical protein